ncbi:MAG: lysine--tRNA ligase [Fimbriimonas sp.]
MSDLSLFEIRREKLEKMRALGCDPFSVERFDFTESAQSLMDNFEEGKRVTFAGRVVSSRVMGKASFAHLSDGDAKIQGYFRKDVLGDNDWEIYQLIDLGDHLGVEGSLFITKTGEKSIHVDKITPLSKAFHNIPVTYYGLSDSDTRLRHRHLDLIANPDSRAMLVNRCKIVSAVRRYLDGLGYLEVETPLLQIEAGGAAATPFKTHYNNYEMDVKLRISLELYLKRLICGDLPKVYEVGRVFRNEKVSNRHNPEFTLLEFYQAYINLEQVMEIVEEMFRQVAIEVFGTAVVDVAERELNGAIRPAYRLDFSQPWARVDMLTAIVEQIAPYASLTVEDLRSLETAKAALGPNPIVNPKTDKRVNPAEENQLGGLIEKLLEVFVEPILLQPTFVVGYPLETSPLAKKDPNNAGFTRRFEGYVMGREVCNAFSEINDPIDQRERFEGQLKARAMGDDEAHPMDEDFLYALECGMPPTGGCGIGLDRMAMLLTGADTIREVLLFPFMKPTESI